MKIKLELIHSFKEFKEIIDKYLLKNKTNILTFETGEFGLLQFSRLIHNAYNYHIENFNTNVNTPKSFNYKKESQYIQILFNKTITIKVIHNPKFDIRTTYNIDKETGFPEKASQLILKN